MNENKLISKAFSKKVLLEIAEQKDSALLKSIIKKAGLESQLSGQSYFDVFEYLYKTQKEHYRNEYVYKNAIAKKIVLGKHKFSNTSFFMEFGVGDVIADVVVVNGSSTAYEIKTEYDSFTRLDRQLRSYEKVFDKVYVVVPDKNIDSALKLIPPNIGILALTKSYTFVEYREAKNNLDKISSRLVFSCLKKAEYEEIILKHIGSLPNVKPAFSRLACKDLFSALDKKIIRDEFFNALKKRQLKEPIKQKVKLLPSSLLALGIDLANSKRYVDSISETLLKTRLPKKYL